MLRIGRGLLLVIVAIAACACRQRAQPAPAMIDDMEQVLSALEIRCTESRTTTPSLTDVAMQAVALAKQRGRDLTTLEALRMLEGSIHEGADMKINCTDAARRLFSELQP